MMKGVQIHQPRIWGLLLYMMLGHVGLGQCDFTVSGEIPDTTEVEYFFDVEGLVHPDLSDPVQGVCAVLLDFRHSYLGDIQIELVSPSGQSVILVGPFTGSIAPTNLSRWNVTFLPCGFPAVPDAGFAQAWSNAQPWQIFTTYSGSYYPFSGCLEDFDTGSANGTWTLRIVDNDPPQAGFIEAFSLIFCDDEGLDCTLCAADPGAFEKDTIAYCPGADLDPDDIVRVYDDLQDSLYHTTLILRQGDTILDIAQLPDIQGLRSGFYDLCGFTYEAERENEILTFLDTVSFDVFRDSLDADPPFFCGALTQTCLKLQIHTLPDTNFVTDTICHHDQVVYGGQIFDSAGVYPILLSSVLGCDSVIILDLRLRDIDVDLLSSGMIECGAVVSLDASGSDGIAPLAYTWTTQFGNIVSDPGDAVITVDQPGQYQVLITDGVCTRSGTITVDGDSSYPQLFAQGGTLNCVQTAVTLTGNSVPPGLDIQWTGPDGFLTTEQDPLATAPGTYFLEVTDSIGCKNVDSAEVLLDTTPVDLALSVLWKDCVENIQSVEAAPQSFITTYAWTGPQDFQSVMPAIQVTEGGVYHLEVTGTNGCVSRDSIDIDGNYDLPDLVVEGQDTINCSEMIVLEASSTTQQVTYAWTTPAGQTIMTDTLLATAPGSYTVEAIAPNMCSVSETIEIFPGTDFPEISLVNGTINCSNDTTSVRLIGNTSLIQEVNWEGPGITREDMLEISVDIPGIYSASIEDTAGCAIHLTALVVEDFALPEYALFYDTINCLQEEAVVGFAPDEPIADFSWQSPSGDVILNPVFLTSEPGLYQLIVTGENGCTSGQSIEVITDTLAPLVFLEGGILGCDDTLQIQTAVLDPDLDFAWSGPQGYQSVAKNPLVSTGGMYTLNVTSGNGCTSVAQVFVDTNFTQPEIIVSADSITCTQPEVMLSGLVDDSSALIRWYLEDSILTDQLTFLTDMAGMYIFEAVGQNRCASRDTVILTHPEVPEIRILSDTITCRMPEVTLAATNSVAGSEYRWDMPGGMMVFDSAFMTSAPGVYRLFVLTPDSCTIDTSLLVAADTNRPVAVAQANGFFSCEVDEVVLNASGSIGNAPEYFWESVSGSPLDPDSLVQITVRSPGIYVLQVTSGTNGCTDRDTIEVDEIGNPLQTIFLTISGECQDRGNGQIVIDSLQTPNGQVMYQLEDGPVQTAPVFSALSAGIYLLSVEDSLGCQRDTLVEVPEVDAAFSVGLGPDTTVLLGDEILLQAETSLDSQEIFSIEWKPEGLTTCAQCLELVISPEQTTVYSVIIQDLLGCQVSDAVRVAVQPESRFYIPNVFSPNGDGKNDVVRVLGSAGISMIRKFVIFDRWGNRMFEVSDRTLQDTGLAWDGTFNGKEALPGVYTYILALEFTNGVERVYSGDITLVR